MIFAAVALAGAMRALPTVIPHSAAHKPRFLREYELPLGTYPSFIVTGPDGALWFSTYPYFTNHQPINLGVGRITTRGKQHFFLIGNGTYDLSVGRDGRIWFTNPYTYVGSKLVPSVGSLSVDGTVKQYSAPDGSPEAIVTGPDGDLWYIDFGATPEIVRIDEQGRTVATYKPPGNRAVQLARGPGKAIWFDLLGRRSGVGYVSEHGAVNAHHLGGPAYIPGPMAFGPDGRMWVSDCTYIAAVTPSFDVTLYAIPNPNGCLAGVTAGPDGNLWAADFDTSSIVRIATDGTMVEYQTPTPDMITDGVTVGPDGNIWFTEIQRNTDVAKIGVLKP